MRSSRLLLCLLGLVCLGAFLPPELLARRKDKSRDVVQSYFEGIDADGNDTFGTRIHTGKRNRALKNYLARHQTAEEGVYGPGDQSTVWDRQLEKRLNPRSSRRDVRRGGSGGYGYRNDCGGW